MKKATLACLPLAGLYLFLPLALAQDAPPAPPAPAPAAEVQEQPAAEAPVEPAPEAAPDVAVAAPEPAPAPEPVIRFQFDGVPYREVVQRYAQAAGKPLVGDMNIEGTLTFFDAEPYTITDAMDALNLILSMKGYALVDTDRHLRIVPLKDLPQMPLKMLRGLDDTGDVRPGEIVTVVLPLQFMDAGETSKAVAPMLSPAGSIAPMTRGRGLIITDRLATIQRIRDMIEQIDGESPGQRQMKTHTLLHASGAVVANLINRTFGAATAPPRSVYNEHRKEWQTMPPSPEDFVTAVYDEASRTLVLFGPGDRVALAEQLIERFEQESGARAGEVRIFYPRKLKAEDLAAMIRQAVPGVHDPNASEDWRRRRRGEEGGVDSSATEARVIVDAATNRIIVTAPVAGQLEAIEKLVAQLDADADNPTRSETVNITRVIRVHGGDVASLVPIVTQATTDRDAPGGPVARLAVTADANSHSLIVTGLPSDVQRAQAVIDELHARPRNAERQVKIFTLDFATANTLAATVQKVLDEESAGRSDVQPALVIADEPGNRLIVTGDATQLARMEAMIAELDRRPAQAKRELRVIPVASQEVTKLAPLVTQLLAEQTANRPDTVPAPQVTADAAGRRLIVLAVADDLARIEAIVKELDGGAAASTQRQTRVFRLESASAAELAPTLEQVVINDANRDRVQVLVDARSNSLVVTGPAETIEAAQQLIVQLDAGPTREPRELRVVELKAADAATLAPMVTELFTSMMRDAHGPTFTPQAKITADVNGNRLVVTAPHAEWQQIQAIVEQLDQVSERASGSRVFKLAKGSAEQMAPIVAEAMTTYDSRNRPIRRGAVAADASTNSLVVTGSSEDLQAAAMIIEQLDGSATRKPREMRTIEVHSTTAAQLAPLALKMWNEQNRNDREAAEVSITADPQANRLLVVAPQDRFAEVEAIIARLDGDRGERVERSLHLVELEQATAAQVTPVIVQLMKEQGARGPSAATITPDTTNNRLMVLATPNDAAMIRQIAEILDSADADSRTHIETVKLEKAQATSLATAVMQTITARQPQDPARNVNVTPEPNSNSLLVHGPAEGVALVVDIIKSLDGESAGGQSDVRIFPLRNGQATALAQTLGTLLRDIFAQQAARRPGTVAPPLSISADARTNSLIVSTTDEQFALVEQLITRLDEAPARIERDVRYVYLDYADPAEVATQVRAMHANRPADETPVIEVDLFGNALTVIANPAELNEIVQTIAKIDDAIGNSSIRTRVVPVAPLQVEVFAPTVIDLYSQMSDSVIEQVDRLPEGGAATPAAGEEQQEGAARRVLIAIDRAANAMVISGPRKDIDAIESLITQLTLSQQIGEAEFRVFRIERADPVAVAATLDEIYNPPVRADQVRRERESRGEREPVVVVAPPPKVSVVAEPRTRSLIVRAKAADFPVLETLIEQLDQVPTIVSEVRVFTLRNTDATEVAGNLNDLFRLASTGGASDTPRGRRAQVIRQMLLRQPPAAIDASEEGDEDDTDGSSAAAANVPQIDTTNMPTITANRATNSIVVAGMPEAIVAIEQIIQELDQSAAMSTLPAVRMYPLEHATVSATVASLREIFAPTARGARGRNAAQDAPIVITGSDAGRVVIASAPPDEHELIAKVIADIDQAQADQSTTVKVYRLNHAQAVSSAAALSASIAPAAPRGRGQQAQPTDTAISADAGSNALVVRASAEDHQRIAALIAELDNPPGDQMPVQLIPLKNADPQRMAQMLSRAFGDAQSARGRGRGATAPVQSVIIEADSSSRTLMVRADDDTFAKIRDLAVQMDESSSGATGVYILPLANGNASDVAAMVRELHGQLVQASRGGPAVDPLAVTADLRANALLLATTAPMHEKVAQWVQEVEAMKPARGTSRVLRIEHADPAEVEKAIRDLFGAAPQGNQRGRGQQPAAGARVETTVLPQQRSLIVNANDEDFETITALLEVLDQRAGQAKPQLRVFQLEHASNTRVAQALSATYAAGRSANPDERVTVTALPQSDAVVVAAPANRMEEVAQLIAQLDTEATAMAPQFRVFQLKNATPSKILPLLNSMLATVRQATGEAITAQADDRTRSIIITARGDALEEVEKIIATLDQAPAYADAEVLIVPLQFADATRLAQVLTAMLQPTANGTAMTPEARALQEQVRRLRVKAGDDSIPELDLTKPIRVIADPIAPNQPGSNQLLISSTPDNLIAMKAVVELMDRAPIASDASVRIVPLAHADAPSVMTVLREVFTQGRTLSGRPGTPTAGRAEPQEGEALVDPLNVSADVRTNTLVMTGTPASLALAEKIVADLDREEGRFTTEVKLFQLQHTDAAQLAPVLQAVFVEVGPQPIAEGVRTQVTRLRTVLGLEETEESELPRTRQTLTIRAAPGTQTLIVAARSDVMPLIEDVIKSMDIQGPRDRNGVRIFPLENAEASRVKTIIDALYTGPQAASTRPEDRPNVAIDTRTNVLIVSASDKTFAVLDALLDDVDRDLPIDLRDIRLIPLKSAEAAPLATMLQQMMDARVTRQAALGVQDAEALRVIIAADPRSNALIVGGSNEGYELVKSLAAQLDAAGPALKGQVQLLPLEHANAGTLATSLSNLFNQRYAAATTPDVQRQRPVILPDMRSNSLLVVANADDTNVLKELLASLDVALKDPAVRLEVLPLVHNDAGVVGPMIQQIFAARLQSMTPPGQPPAPQDRVDVATNSLANALIVSASNENLVMVRALLAKIDVEPPAESGVVKLFTLKNSDATRIATMLQGIISQGLYKPGTAAANDPLLAARERVAITADTRTNVLIVSASKENLAIIAEIIEQIDSSEDFGALSDMRVYVLRHASAVRIAPTLQQLFTAKRQAEIAAGGSGRSLPTSVIPDARTNALLVTGSRESFAAIDELVARLDAEAASPAAIFRVFELKQATAASLQPMLQQLFQQRAVRGNNSDPVTVIAEPKTNTLIVGASPEDMKLAEEMIARLDAGDRTPGISTKVFALAKADAAQVAATIEQLFNDQGQSSGVAISVDERLNAIVASAGVADLQRIGELVTQLDTETVTKVTEIRVFGLRNADATELADILMTALTNQPQGPTNLSPNRQTLLQFATLNEDGKELIASALQDSLLITPDRRTNTLVVKAPAENMPLLRRLVEAMDSATPRIAQVKVFKLKNADARQMSDVLQQLFRLQPGSGNADHAISYTLVAPGGASRQAESAPASDAANGNGASPQSASAVVGSAEQYALSVTVDVRTNSLLIGGTEGYVNLASDIIEELDSSPAQERQTQVYRLRNSQATDIETALRSFLDQERQRLVQTLGTDGLGAAQRLLEQEVAVVAEAATNTLLISASPRYFDTVMTMVKELDQAPPQVLIQVLLAEVTLDDGEDLGFEWEYTKGLGSLGTGSVGTDLGVEGLQNRLGGFALAVTGGDLTFMLRALQTQGRLQVLSRPQVLATDNQEASINVGQSVPIVTDSRVTESGSVFNTISFRDVGIILNVTPRINVDGFVKLDVEPEISSLAESTVQISEGLNAPIFNTRSAQTTVSVQDGHTIIIGGLITTTDSMRESKVPLLGDVPGLGVLFRNTSVTTERTELLIILTPRIVRNREDADRITAQEADQLDMIGNGEHDKFKQRILEPLDGAKSKPDPVQSTPQVD